MKWLVMAGALAVCVSSCRQSVFINGSNLDIYNGSTDSSNPAVGLLIKQGKFWCTATIIGARTALSAGHCFDARSDENHVGLQLQLDQELVDVTKVVVHPDYSDWFGRVTHDVAVLELDDNVTVEPSPIAVNPPQIDEPLELVGYGYVDALMPESMDGTRRRGTSYLESFETYKIFLPRPTPDESQVCKGDSGGPIFAIRNGQKVQIGIVSGSTDGRARKTCEIDAYGARVDAYVEWIIEQSRGDVVLESIESSSEGNQ